MMTQTTPLQTNSNLPTRPKTSCQICPKKEYHLRPMRQRRTHRNANSYPMRPHKMSVLWLQDQGLNRQAGLENSDEYHDLEIKLMNIDEQMNSTCHGLGALQNV